MDDNPHDFDTGLRAHLGLEHTVTNRVGAPVAAPEESVAQETVAAPDNATLGGLEALESELLERERAVVQREAGLASRAGALLTAAQALYDDVLGRGPSPTDDELARLRRRKSVA